MIRISILREALFVNFKLIFLNIKVKPKTQHTNIWPIYIYVHTVIRLYCCWDVKVTLSCLVFYSFVLSFIRWRWKITIIYLVYIHTLYVFSWSNQHYADNNNIFIFHHWFDHEEPHSQLKDALVLSHYNLFVILSIWHGFKILQLPFKFFYSM